jgi:hypothetical protein
MGFWEFCNKRPIVMLFAIVFLSLGIAEIGSDIASSITGHWQPTDCASSSLPTFK